MDYVIVIPAHNEAAFIGQTLESILKQEIPPKEVIVVNDNSTDDTALIVDRFIETMPYLFQVKKESLSEEHMPGSKVVQAFNTGFAQLTQPFDFVVKLDADIILPPDYFKNIIEIFKLKPQVGIAGGFAYEQNAEGVWTLNHPMDKNHVRGAFKAYTKACFEAIGGLRSAMGWDTVDELLAQYRGFDIHTDSELRVKHLRPTGNAYNKKAKLLQGKAMYTMRYGFWISLIASTKMAWMQRNAQVLLHNLQGYFRARNKEEKFLVTPEEGQFIRGYRWKNIKGKLFQNR